MNRVGRSREKKERIAHCKTVFLAKGFSINTFYLFISLLALLVELEYHKKRYVEVFLAKLHFCATSLHMHACILPPLQMMRRLSAPGILMVRRKSNPTFAFVKLKREYYRQLKSARSLSSPLRSWFRPPTTMAAASSFPPFLGCVRNSRERSLPPSLLPSALALVERGLPSSWLLLLEKAGDSRQKEQREERRILLSFWRGRRRRRRRRGGGGGGGGAGEEEEANTLPFPSFLPSPFALFLRFLPQKIFPVGGKWIRERERERAPLFPSSSLHTSGPGSDARGSKNRNDDDEDRRIPLEVR